MLKVFSICLIIMTIPMTPTVFASKGRVATDDDILLLKRDFLEGRVKVGKTRLKRIRDLYGNAQNITDTTRKIVYDYGDLRIEFEKNKYLRKWEYDRSEPRVYSNSVDDLRFDLEDGQIVGDWVSLEQIRKDYDEPTRVHEKSGDGEYPVYYWGQLKLTFENYYVVSSWRGGNLKDALQYGHYETRNLSTTPASSEAETSGSTGGVY